MKMLFMSPRGDFGHRKYLAVDTDIGVYSRQCPAMIPHGIEVKVRDLNEIKNKCIECGYKEIPFIY